MKKLIFCLSLLLISCRAFALETAVLFLLFDAGETHALLPLMKKCDEAELPYQVVAFGTAKALVQNALEIDLPVDLARETALEPQEIEKICALVQPQIVISGVASTIQGQFLEAYRGTAKTYAFWDNFSASGANPYFAVAQQVQQKAEIVLFPSKQVADAPEFADRPEAEKLVVGHPVLDQWRETLLTLDKKAILEKLHCNLDRFVVTYIGSYGPEYEKAYSLFLEYIETLEKDLNYLCHTENETANVLVQAHPKTGGEFERERSAPHFLINQLPTIEAIAAADLVISYNSTAAYQALLLGKDLFYFIPEGDSLTNSAIEMGLAKRISSPAEFDQAFYKSRVDACELLGIPSDSTDRLFTLISSYLQ